MKKRFIEWLKSIGREIRAHPVNYFLLGLVLGLGLFVRIYRAGDLLGFYYDQGRDALVIWRLWHEGKLFLIGPVTGLAGIFLGPFYYYLIAPFYLVGGGNPVVPAVFLAFLATAAIFVLYYLGWKTHSRATGLIAAIIASFSYYIVLSSRWLANPTAILLTSVLLLFSMWRLAMGADKRWWIGIALLVGLSLQLEAASAVFYLPMILVFYIWLLLSCRFGGQKQGLPNKKTFFVASALFLATLLPQILFNFRHDNILLDGFKRVTLEERSFKLPLKADTKFRMEYFWSVYHSKLFPGWKTYAAVFSVFSATVLLVARKSFLKTKILPLLIIFIGVPMLSNLTFYGNFGNMYDYYMTGYYLPMILLFSLGLGELWKTKGGKFVVSAFFVLFFMENGVLVRNHLIATVQSRPIVLEDQLQAVDWVFEDAKERGEFNVDVYVPPVIPYAYDYLFLWQGTLRQASAVSSSALGSLPKGSVEPVQGKLGCEKHLCGLNQDKLLPLLYTLYEEDSPHPERLQAWLDRQKGIGLVEEEEKYGGITVQRRLRL